ncbi:MAG: adenylosuccinate lyase [Candidatus Altiarchaeales archaeon]|nr:adenylosuccinate lyase [Candidatus Altiarchaeales archaeon]
MAVHPIEYRYGRAEVKKIFEEETRVKYMLLTEAALAQAHASVGNIPQAAADEIKEKAKLDYVCLDRVKAIEAEIHHDVMALVKALDEQCGDSGKYIHLGATSNDVTDTALALQIRDYIFLLEKNLLDLRNVLLSQAEKHKKTVCVGRTHAQHAVPTTYGLKFGIWAAEMQRHLERLNEIKPRILVGQMTGAVGTQAAFGEHAAEIQRQVMVELGLGSVDLSNQVIQRDRHSEFMLHLALISESLNKFSTEIRNLQRTEIMEVAEGFRKKQVGSSTMPHKMNPIYAERICGLSRIVKSCGVTSLENIPLWHERDLTNSSPERIILPEAAIILDYILQLSIDLMENLVFHPENIKRNLEMTGGRIMAESVMISLVEAGVSRQKAHEMVRECALESVREKTSFKDKLLAHKEVSTHLSEKQVDEALDPANYVGTAEKQVQDLAEKYS